MKQYELKEFEIWSEGYAATGESEQAVFYGVHKGRNFQDACMRYFLLAELNQREWHDANDSYYDTSRFDYNGNSNSIWACKLYDNEADARKNFG